MVSLIDLGSLPGGYSSFASSINARGEIVGASQNGQIDPLTAYPETIAVLWKNGIMNLGTLGGNQSVANAINDRGQVAGAALNAISDPFANSPLSNTFSVSHNSFSLFPQQPKRTRFAGPKLSGMQDLGTLGGPDSTATFVNQCGQIAGQSYTSFKRQSDRPGTQPWIHSFGRTEPWWTLVLSAEPSVIQTG